MISVYCLDERGYDRFVHSRWRQREGDVLKCADLPAYVIEVSLEHLHSPCSLAPSIRDYHRLLHVSVIATVMPAEKIHLLPCLPSTLAPPLIRKHPRQGDPMQENGFLTIECLSFLYLREGFRCFGVFLAQDMPDLFDGQSSRLRGYCWTLAFTAVAAFSPCDEVPVAGRNYRISEHLGRFLLPIFTCAGAFAFAFLVSGFFFGALLLR